MEYGVVESWMKLSVFLSKDSSVLSLDSQEDSLVMLEGGQFVLLGPIQKRLSSSIWKLLVYHMILDLEWLFLESCLA